MTENWLEPVSASSSVVRLVEAKWSLDDEKDKIWLQYIRNLCRDFEFSVLLVNSGNVRKPRIGGWENIIELSAQKHINFASDCDSRSHPEPGKVTLARVWEVYAVLHTEILSIQASSVQSTKEIVVCGKCSGMYTRKHFGRHKKQCIWRRDSL